MIFFGFHQESGQGQSDKDEDFATQARILWHCSVVGSVSWLACCAEMNNPPATG